MGIIADLHRQLHGTPATPSELTIDDGRVTELSIELANMSRDWSDFAAIEEKIRSGQSMMFGLPLRVIPSAGQGPR